MVVVGARKNRTPWLSFPLVSVDCAIAHTTSAPVSSSPTTSLDLGSLAFPDNRVSGLPRVLHQAVSESTRSRDQSPRRLRTRGGTVQF